MAIKEKWGMFVENKALQSEHDDTRPLVEIRLLSDPKFIILALM
jgi:hypothetical protein